MTNELHPEIEKLVQDPEFIDWVHDGCPSGERDKFLEGGIDEEKLDESVKLVKSLRFDPVQFSKTDEDRLLQRIKDSVELDSKSSDTPSKTRWIYYISGAVAACLLALVIFSGPSDDLVLSTEYAENLNHELPDGSKLVMNAVSTIEYKEKSFDQSRRVELEGEAFFNVEKGDDFIVNTEFGLVEVLGTSFNVFARDGKFEVSCVTGKVKVSTKDKSSFVILTAGESCRLAEGKISRVNLPYEKDAWIKGRFYYDDNRLSEILSEIERQFGIDIKYDKEIANTRYTGFFDTSDLQSAFESVLWPLRLDYRKIADKKYVITSQDSG